MPALFYYPCNIGLTVNRLLFFLVIVNFLGFLGLLGLEILIALTFGGETIRIFGSLPSLIFGILTLPLVIFTLGALIFLKDIFLGFLA
jgi:hypothetical protein